MVVVIRFCTRALVICLFPFLFHLQYLEAQSERSGSGVDPAMLEFFEKRVRPILANRCYPCHGPDAGQGQAGLRLDSLAGMLRGGRSGPAMAPGDPRKSLFILAINHDTFVQMPPKTKLPQAEIQTLSEWVRTGAPWPNAEIPAVQPSAASSDHADFTEEEKSFWAFQPVVEPTVPAVENPDWAKTTIDRFVLAQLEAKGLRPAQAADKRTLIRRATIDLHGLPPTRGEVAAFLADDSSDAFARVVERLLASPRYGERWGRHWLDVARYADSNGMDDNLTYADAWRYRDYVIAAFNDDKSYDQFVREQLAGDLLTTWSDESRAESLIATGFLMVGPKMLAEDDPVKQQMDIADEQLDTSARAFMGLTMGCARCHDHKYDPLRIADYYSLAGIFKSTGTMISYRVDSKWNATALESSELNKRLSELEREIDAHDDVLVNGNMEKMSSEEREKHEQNLEAAKRGYASIPKAMAVTEGKVEDLPIFLRGNHLTPGKLAPRGFPRILAGDRRRHISDKQSGRREFAEWLTAPEHPLTARVMVNRIWKWHFGQGIVRSPNNFGRLGERPDNQPLLDWLTIQFIESGWSVKAMHRLILFSNSYQMSTTSNHHNLEVDPENRLLWRRDRLRMEVEVIRDSLLAVSGQLDLTMGGTLIPHMNFVNLSSEGKARDPALYESRRRSVYLPVLRSALYEVFQSFDFPAPAVTNGQRSRTTVASQALFMMNSKLMLEASNRLAEQLLAEPARDDKQRIARAYELVLLRSPSTQETKEWLDFLAEYQQGPHSEIVEAGPQHRRAWQGLCRVLLSSNEFVYVD